MLTARPDGPDVTPFDGRSGRTRPTERSSLWRIGRQSEAHLLATSGLPASLAPSPVAAATGIVAPLRHVLPNGLTVLAAPMPHLASASVAVFVRAGSRDESDEVAGLSHFLEHMAFKGTARRTVQELNLAAESLGADLNAYTDKDATCYYLEGLGRHVPQMLDLLADIVLDSTLPPDELERERQVILQECAEYEEDPEQLSFTLLDEALWGPHPMGRPIVGTARSIAAIEREHLVAHVRSHYVADRMVVAAAGNFDIDAFLAQAEGLFAGVPHGPGAGYRPPEPPRHVGRAIARRLPGLSQSYLYFAWPVASRGQHPHLSSLAATLFGGGMSAPLVDAVRERLGLAYSVGATADIGDVHGAFVVDATTLPSKIPMFTRTVAALLQEHAGSIAPQDLARAKNQLAVSLVRAGERPLRMLQRCVEQLWADGSLFDLPGSIDAMHAVEAEAVRQLFETMLAQPAATTLVGAGAAARRVREIQSVVQLGEASEVL